VKLTLRPKAISNPSLDFLEETYDNFKDKDGSVLPSSLKQYVPYVRVNKKRTKRAGNTQTSGQSNCANENENNNKRLKTVAKTSSTFNATGTTINANNTDAAASSLLSITTDDAPLEKAIADAANSKESRILDKIVADEDDYDWVVGRLSQQAAGLPLLGFIRIYLVVQYIQIIRNIYY